MESRINYTCLQKTWMLDYTWFSFPGQWMTLQVFHTFMNLTSQDMAILSQKMLRTISAILYYWNEYIMDWSSDIGKEIKGQKNLQLERNMK